MKPLLVAVVVAEEVDEDMDVDEVVAVVLVVIFPMTRTHLPLLTKDLLKGRLGIPQKDVVMVHHVGLIVAVVVVVVDVDVLAMVKLVMMDAQEEPLNATVGLDEGNTIFHYSSSVSLFLSLFMYNVINRSNCRNEFKRDGAGRGNWGTQSDEIAQ